MDLMTYALCKGNGGGGGSSDFIVTFTPTNEAGTDGITDKTGAELYQAYKDGKRIVFSLPYLHLVTYVSCVADYGTVVQPSATIAFTPDGTNFVLAHAYTGQANIDSDNPLQYTVCMFALTPLS